MSDHDPSGPLRTGYTSEDEVFRIQYAIETFPSWAAEGCTINMSLAVYVEAKTYCVRRKTVAGVHELCFRQIGVQSLFEKSWD